MKHSIDLTGKVIDITTPTEIPGKEYKVCFITIEVEDKKAKFKAQQFNYYTFKYFMPFKRKLISIDIGLKINCVLERTSKLWKKDNIIQTKPVSVWIGDGQKMEIGRQPIIFEEYTACGLVTKVDDNEPIYYENLQNIDELPPTDDLPF